MAKRYEIDMTSGNLLKKILLFALPLMLSSLLQLLYNACDIIVIGQFRDHTALSAISSTSSLINLTVTFFIGLSVGTNIVMAKCYGSKDPEKANKVAHTSLIIAFVGGIFLSIIGVIFAKEFLILMDSPSDVIDLATIYVRIYFLGMPFNLLYNFGAALLRASGDTKRPLIFLAISGVLNVVSNLFFVLVCNMSTDGVALATILSQLVSAILVIITLFNEKGYCHISFKYLKIDFSAFKEIIKLGLPAGLQGIIFSLSNVIIQSSINSFGSYVMAGNGAASNIEGFVYVSMNAFYHASLTFTGQNVGAKKYENIKVILKYCLYYVGIFGIGAGLIATLLANPVLSIYSNSPDVIMIGSARLYAICLFYFLCGLMDVMVGTLRGLGHANVPMIISLIGVCGFRLLWVGLVFNLTKNLGLLYLSYPISWIITFFAEFIYFLHCYKKEISFKPSK